MNFLELGLSEDTVKAIEELKVKQPTTVQIDVIPSILEGKDVFTIAPRGCGKTMSYVLPLIDVINRKKGQNILIITPNSKQANTVSDRLSMFNRYHLDEEENEESEDNVIIGTPDLLLELAAEEKIDFSKVGILVVDDINLIKSNKQLENLEKILEMLPSDKQNIVYTNRRSKDTQSILDKILQAPAEIKVNKEKECEAENFEKPSRQPRKNERPMNPYKVSATQKDEYALELAKKYNSFNGKIPDFLTNKGIIVEID